MVSSHKMTSCPGSNISVFILGAPFLGPPAGLIAPARSLDVVRLFSGTEESCAASAPLAAILLSVPVEDELLHVTPSATCSRADKVHGSVGRADHAGKVVVVVLPRVVVVAAKAATRNDTAATDVVVVVAMTASRIDAGVAVVVVVAATRNGAGAVVVVVVR